MILMAVAVVRMLMVGVREEVVSVVSVGVVLELEEVVGVWEEDRV
jgi:hypothetical protein